MADYYEMLWGIEHDERLTWVDRHDGSFISQQAMMQAIRAFQEQRRYGNRKVGLFHNGHHVAGHDFAPE